MDLFMLASVFADLVMSVAVTFRKGRLFSMVARCCLQWRWLWWSNACERDVVSVL